MRTDDFHRRGRTHTIAAREVEFSVTEAMYSRTRAKPARYQARGTPRLRVYRLLNDRVAQRDQLRLQVV